MSIIEQAVNALGKGKDDGREKKPAETNIDSGHQDPGSVNTVQRSESSTNPQDLTTIVDTIDKPTSRVAPETREFVNREMVKIPF